MRVAEIMSTPVRTIQADQTAEMAWEQMRRNRTRHLVVATNDGGIVGVVSTSDLGGTHGEALRRGRQVRDLMTEKVVAVTPTTTVREAANLMRGHVVNCLPVFEGDKLLGIVTALDLLELIGRGAERPVAKSERWILKDRGPRTGSQRVAKLTSRAKSGRT